ncbi:MAG: hypothetical protein AAGK22_01210 [Acidobacteriota bacterium]
MQETRLPRGTRRTSAVRLCALFSVALTTPLFAQNWAFEETFDGQPGTPSAELLPRTFDYAVTHRTHPKEHDKTFVRYPADHGMSCAGPENPVSVPDRQHLVRTTHLSSGAEPDESFYLCRDHMMSSMGDVEGYSVTAFWPKQEFDFSRGGVLEFDVNINDDHPRSWWEVLIAPRDQLRIGPAEDWLPIDETYPADRILLTFHETSKREIKVGTGAIAPDGWTVNEDDWRDWRDIDADDPALSDRRVRRTMRVELERAEIRWSVEKADGTFDTYSAPVPDGLPFTRGLVQFKTHAYTPEKDGNDDAYTFHWDNVRFTGPVVGRYEVYETTELAYLQANGDRDIGDRARQHIALPRAPTASDRPVLVGQLHGALRGQVLLRINGETGARRVDPLHYSDSGCGTTGWTTFRVPLDPEDLNAGTNVFEWEIGPRPDCAIDWWWDGFSVKSLEVQMERDAQQILRPRRRALPRPAPNP